MKGADWRSQTRITSLPNRQIEFRIRPAGEEQLTVPTSELDTGFSDNYALDGMGKIVSHSKVVANPAEDSDSRESE